MWNLGSLLGLVLMVQIITGFLLTLIYTNSTAGAFTSLHLGMVNHSYAFLLNAIHLSGASLFFFVMFLHILKGLTMKSYTLTGPWMVGVTLLILSMIVAFMGYVLPYGSMSFWGCTVITNLLSVIPFVGDKLVLWLWGGFMLGDSVLKLFFTLHFLLPFVLLALVLFHLLELHKTGSKDVLGGLDYSDSTSFSLFMVKDVLNLVVLFGLLFVSLLFPHWLASPDSYTPANPLMSPLHIAPEWYFLFAYAILRSIPTKLGGVVALLMSVLVLYILPLANKSYYSKFTWFLVCCFIGVFIMLTFIGSKGVEAPYIFMGQVFTFLYFFLISLFLL